MKRPVDRFKVLLPGYEETSPRFSMWAGIAFWIMLIIFLASIMPTAVLTPGTTVFIATIGIIGIWRYSWAAMHYVRAFRYKFFVFPRIRAAADAARLPLPYFYILVTSFRMSAQMNAAVYGRLIDEIAACGSGATIIAGVTDPADIEVLRRVVRRHAESARVVLLPVFQAGKGKRHAMADALELIAARHPKPGSQVILMDGDTLLGEGCLARAASIIQTNPDIGAVTTENVPLVKGSTLQREWYRLRMAQRSVLMCSVSLSRKVMVLTGRLSLFRAEIATRPDFIVAVRSDVIHHWRLGRIALLTGDDKSTWYAVLRSGWNMLYVPDAVAHPLEELPAGGFVPASLALMSRWYGNMIRANGRALALGPRRTGWFLWMCLLDQRLSMWTTLIGPTFAGLLGLLHAPVFLLIYVFWIVLTRSFNSVVIGLHGGRFHPWFPALLYYTQFVGSVVKVFMSFHPYRQKWTRQKLAAGSGSTGLAVLNSLTSYVYNIAAVIAFVLFVAYIGDVASQADRQLGRASGSDIDLMAAETPMMQFGGR
ncbi:glycosyltransferase [Tistrella mobilis]|uniref:glycosyltransferase n=1 Tax=Tistrella mobilis TaxID=171437 RepID=UPI003557AD32